MQSLIHIEHRASWVRMIVFNAESTLWGRICKSTPDVCLGLMTRLCKLYIMMQREIPEDPVPRQRNSAESLWKVDPAELVWRYMMVPLKLKHDHGELPFPHSQGHM
ncbi:hypothetical protein XENOCAPTIV_029899 [Xenoophorus captivus]|uniref:Uncharacterized protein n=1 Tax=Xenoophorus captivus TaxID=1517983 RepID=A0ABV0R6V8_9TELE